MKRGLGMALLLCAACSGNGTDPPVPSTTLGQVPGHDTVAQDNSHKEPPRLGVAESYLGSYLKIFGGATALQAQRDLQAAGNNLFDNWAAYLGALGLPSYAIDLPRRGETNALMIAAFERLGEALCDRALERDLKATPAVPVDKRMVYAFDLPTGALDKAGFQARFDVLHRTFLSYPVALAPTDRVTRFYKLYQDTAAKHAATSKFTAQEEGWAAMCSALVRHPEFHLY